MHSAFKDRKIIVTLTNMLYFRKNKISLDKKIASIERPSMPASPVVFWKE